MNKTAVQWLINQLEQKGDASVNVSIGRMQISIKEEEYIDLIKQALEKEKKQIRYAYEQGENDYECREEERYDKESLSEQYYNQTYNQNK